MFKYKTDPVACFKHVGRKQNSRGTEIKKCFETYQFECSRSNQICWKSSEQNDWMGKVLYAAVLSNNDVNCFDFITKLK